MLLISLQSEPGSNGNEGVVCISQISKDGASLSDSLTSYTGHSLREGLPLSKNVHCVFYIPSRRGYNRPGYDTKLHRMVKLQFWYLGNVEYPFVTVNLRLTLLWLKQICLILYLGLV